MGHPWLQVPVVIVLMLQLNANWAFAQTTSSTISASSAATAGSGRASVEAIDVHGLNPANLVHLRRSRDLHTSYSKDGWILGITDNSKDVIVPAALSFAKTKFAWGPDEAFREDLRLSLAGYASNRVSVGLTGRQSELKSREAVWRQMNADLAATWIPIKNLGLAAVAYDFLGTARDVPEEIRLQSRLGFGANYIFKDIMRFRADIVSDARNDFAGRSLLLGYEIYTNEFVLIRLGWGDERAYERQIWSAGLGLDLPRFRLNYAYQAGLRGEFENRHSVDLGIPF